jgi:hypothetical protein
VPPKSRMRTKVTFFSYAGVDRLRAPVLLFDAAGLSSLAPPPRKGDCLRIEPGRISSLGMLTGIGGGMARDVLLSEIPAGAPFRSLRRCSVGRCIHCRRRQHAWAFLWRLSLGRWGLVLRPSLHGHRAWLPSACRASVRAGSYGSRRFKGRETAMTVQPRRPMPSHVGWRSTILGVVSSSRRLTPETSGCSAGTMGPMQLS